MSRPLTMLLFALVASGTLLFGTADTAEAHVCMDYPVSRVGPECVARSPQKVGPCGLAERSEYINEFRPGETVTVILRETINHPSHYRIAFNPEGDHFVDPVAVDDMSGDHPYVLVDGIEDTEDAIQEVEITFPDVECEECTLQLIQVMYDKQANGFGGRDSEVMDADDNDDLYYSCADIVLRRDGGSDASAGRDDADPQDDRSVDSRLERFALLARDGSAIVRGRSAAR